MKNLDIFEFDGKQYKVIRKYYHKRGLPQYSIEEVENKGHFHTLKVISYKEDSNEFLRQLLISCIGEGEFV